MTGKNLKFFLFGVVVTLLATSATAAFAESTQSIQAIFGRVKLVVNDQLVNQETLLYRGTTYVPLRAAAEALDKEVAWDADTNTAYIDEKGTNRSFDDPIEEPQTGLAGYYAGFYGIPDFGAFYGLEPTGINDKFPDVHTYYYVPEEMSERDLALYFTLLGDEGFVLESDDTSGKSISRTYINNNLKITVVLSKNAVITVSNSGV